MEASNSANKWSLLEFETMSLDEWEKHFYERGSEQLGGLTPSSIWLRSVENAGTRVAEFIRREEYQEAVESLGEALGLLCCFVRKYREGHELSTLSDIAWNKYPGMCYACADKIPENEVKQKDYVSCICLGMQGKPKAKKKSKENLERAQKMKKKPRTLDEWSGMIKAIYKEAHSVLPISGLCLHFIEEIGEVTRELYEYDALEKRNTVEKKVLAKKIKKLEGEIADTFSWIFGLVNKIDQLFEKARDYYAKDVKLCPLKASEIARDALRAFPREHE